MSIKYVCIIVATLALGLCSCAAERGENWTEPESFFSASRQEQYDVINDKLMAEVNSWDPGENMSKVYEWLAKEKSAGVTSGAYLEALEQLFSLTKINRDHQCNRDTIAILLRNEYASRERTQMPESELKLPLRRVEQIVRQSALAHARHCYHNYPKRYVAMRDSMLAFEMRRRAETFIRALVGEEKVRQVKTSILGTKEAAVAAWKALDSLVPRAGPSRESLDKGDEQVGSLVETYLVKPCEQFTRVLGPDFFIAALYDKQILEPNERRARQTSRSIEIVYNNGLAQYYLCHALPKRKAELTSMLREYIQSK